MWIRNTKTRGGLQPDKYLSDEQFRRLMAYARGCGELARTRGKTRGVFTEFVVELLSGTGLRVSEACNLNLSDLPISHGKCNIWVRNGKGGVTRIIDISERLNSLIKRYVRLYRKGAGPDDPLLVSERGKRLHIRCMYHCVQKAGQRSGVGKIYPHMLRHTYLTRLYNIEKDLRFVQDQAGHASPTTTAIYAKTNNKARKRQVQALDEEEF